MKNLVLALALLVTVWGLVGCGDDELSPSLHLRLGNFDIVNRADNQDKPDAAYSHYEREYLVVWQDDRFGNSAVLGILIDDTFGEPESSAIRLSEDENASMVAPRVAISPEDQVYLVVWDDTRNSRHDIYGQLVDELTGSLVGSNFPVDSSVGNKYNPRVAYNSEDKTFFVVYEVGDGTAKDIYGVIVTTAGSAGTPAAIETDSANQRRPDVAYNSDDSTFLVCWEDFRSENTSSDIWGAVCGADGTPGTPDEIYAGDSDQRYPCLAFAARASRNYYLLAFEDHSEGDAEIFTVRVDAGGVAMGSAVNITSSFWQQMTPAVSYDPERDHFVVAWKDNYSGTDDIFANLISGATGDRIHEFSIISQDRFEGNEHAPAIALNTWEHEFLFVFAFDINGDWDVAGQFAH